jgi:diguanylate cyclase (GGDEF)-like protein
MQGIAIAGGLSGIGCREDFNVALACAWRAHQQQPLSLLLIEIDLYQQYQSICGIAAGDDCLDAIAAAILETARLPGAQAFAWGTGRFALLLPQAEQRQAERLAAEIRFQVEALLISHPRSPVSRYVSVSIGIAAATPQAEIAAVSLSREAEAALSRARGV